MRTNLNFSPLFRSTIGFDRVFDLLENASRTQSFESWPPYDIVRTSEDSYRITMAVAGFSDAELSITHQPNLLIVAGSKPEAISSIVLLPQPLGPSTATNSPRSSVSETSSSARSSPSRVGNALLRF